MPAKVQLTTEQIQEVIKLYTVDKLGSPQIAEKIGIKNPKIILNVLKENNVPIITHKHSPYTHVQELIDLYKAGWSTVKLNKKFGHHKSLIVKILRENGVNVPTYGGCTKKYKINENYFETIDTPEKAYLIGLMQTDGCIKKIKLKKLGCSYKIQLGLQMEDKDHLQKILNWMGSDYPISDQVKYTKTGKATYFSRFVITSNKMGEDLLKHNIFPKKTGKVTKPNTIPTELEKYFWLGAVDGDGCLTKTKHQQKRRNIKTKEIKYIDNYTNFSINLVGNYDFVNGFYIFCKNNYNLQKNIHIKQKGKTRYSFPFYSCTIYNKEAFIVMTSLYQYNKHISLERKYNRYLKYTGNCS